MDRHTLFVLASARHEGNTEALARQVAVPAGTTQTWLPLTDLDLPWASDLRHEPGATLGAHPTGVEGELFDATMAATDVVIVSPLYWYSVSALAKNYLDFWSGWLRVPGFREGMRGRNLWGITVLSEVDRTQADPVDGMLRRTAEYMGMRWGGLLLGYGNRPGDVLADTEALENARCFLDLGAGTLCV